MTTIIPHDATPRKRCSNPACRQWYPATPEYFSRDRSKKDGLCIYCKQCEKVRSQARWAARHPNRKRVRVAASEGMKYCPTCEQVLPATLEFFRRDSHRPDGFSHSCKECRRQYNQRPDVREKKRSYNRTYLERPGMREHLRAQSKERYHTNAEVRSKALARNRRPDVQAYMRAYLKEYNQHPEGKEKRRAGKHTYRAREKAVAGKHTAQQIQDLLKRQKHKCYYCGKQFEKRNGRYVYAVDHTFPISRVAGTDIPANDISYLVLACPSCNRDKCDKFPWEWPQGGRLL